MGRTLLALAGGLVAFLLVLGLMLFAGINWHTVVEVSLIFGKPVWLRLVLLLLGSTLLGFGLALFLVARAFQLSRRKRRLQGASSPQQMLSTGSARRRRRFFAGTRDPEKKGSKD